MSELYKVSEEAAKASYKSHKESESQSISTKADDRDNKRDISATISTEESYSNAVPESESHSSESKEEGNKKQRLETKDMTDVCGVMDLKDGDQIEVHWDVQGSNGEVSITV